MSGGEDRLFPLDRLSGGREAQAEASTPLIEIRQIPEELAPSVDPRATHVVWATLSAKAARPDAITSAAELSQALRAHNDVLLHTFDAERTAAFTRIATSRDDRGRPRLELSLAVGVLGTPDEAAADAEHCLAVASAALERPPAPFAVERTPPGRLLDTAPKYCATIRQRLVELSDEADTAYALARWDRQPESWKEMVSLFLRHPAPLMYQAMFVASALSAGEILWLEQQALAAERIRARATEQQNPVLAVRAARMTETNTDTCESYRALVYRAMVVVASDEPLPRPLLRSIGSSITNELDVIHAGQAAPVVAARARLVGGLEIRNSDPDAVQALQTGLPVPVMRDLPPHESLPATFSPTEAGLAFRWPMGRIPTMPVEGQTMIPAPADLPNDGIRFGSDVNGVPLFLGDGGHQWVLGATGAGKSTGFLSAIRSCLQKEVPLIVFDPHGSLARAARFSAARLRRNVAVVDANEPESIRIDLLDGIDPTSAGEDEISRIAKRGTDAVKSHLPNPEWAGPRFDQLSDAGWEFGITADPRRRLRIEDVGRLMADRQFLAEVLEDHPHADGHAALILRQLHGEREPDTALWASSKYDSAFRNPTARAIFAPFGEGISTREIIEANLPLVVDLSGGSRTETRLPGHILLSSILDYVLSREPNERTPLYLFVDEASLFPADALTRALSEGRKYGLHLWVANQSISQLDDDLVDALLANAGRIAFRPGLRDARFVAPLIGLAAEELTSLPNLQAVVDLPGNAPFSVRLDPPDTVPDLEPYRQPRALRASARRPRSAEGLHEKDIVDDLEWLALDVGE